MANKKYEETFEQAVMRQAVITAMLTLDDEKWLVLFHRYYNDLTYDQIALVLDISKEQAQGLEAAAMRELRHPRISKGLRELWQP